jgi:lipoate-protein ligase A
MRWRLLDMPPMTAAENMALDETLLDVKARGETPNTIRFLQFLPRAVLLGFHQSLSEEVRKTYCEENQIDINRRITGGGAIFFDETQIGWEVICDKIFFKRFVQRPRFFKQLCSPVITALGTLGLEAAFRPRNDIEIRGRKISGTGGTELNGAFLFQGTMLVDFDVKTMLRTLRIPVEKLKAKEIDSVKERVTCLNWELGYTPPREEIKAAIRAGFEECLDMELEVGGLTDTEKRLFEKKVGYFESPEWIDLIQHKTKRPGVIQSAYKGKAGLVRFTLVFDGPHKKIKEIYITGDFLSFPTRALFDLEAALRGAPIDRERIHKIVHDFFNQGLIQVPGMSSDDFLTAMDLALEKLAMAKWGIPIEYCNLISVTNGSFHEVLRKVPSVLLLPYCSKNTDCDLRYRKGCRSCGECTVGEARNLGRDRKMKSVCITRYEDLWDELMRMKKQGVPAFIGCCCQPFFTKHIDDFERAGMPGILLDIDNTTCYDLDQAEEAYAGLFESQTSLNLDLLKAVLALAENGSLEPVG